MPDIESAGTWRKMVAAAGLVNEDGAVGETVFGQMTQLALRHGAINLGQGAPSASPPPFLVDAVHRAMQDGFNQYAPGKGYPQLREAIARQRARDCGHEVSPDDVLVTVGATEALTASILALAPAGSDVVVLEPFYDSYAAAVAAAGATLVTVPLLPDESGRFEPDWRAFEAAMSPNTSILIVNTPHNPSGAVLTATDLERLFTAAQQADAWVVTDEVYEYLVFDGTHRSLAAIVDEPERVITISSAGKSFNATGWKTGWAIAAPEVLLAIQSVKQFLTYQGASPQQIALAEALDAGPAVPHGIRDGLEAARDVLFPAFDAIDAVTTWRPEAGYFVLVDFSAVTDEEAFALNERITRDFGVTGIPVPGLCRKGSVTAEFYRSTIRYSFCKSAEDVAEGARRITLLGKAIARGEFGDRAS